MDLVEVILQLVIKAFNQYQVISEHQEPNPYMHEIPMHDGNKIVITKHWQSRFDQQTKSKWKKINVQNMSGIQRNIVN